MRVPLLALVAVCLMVAASAFVQRPANALSGNILRQSANRRAVERRTSPQMVLDSATLDSATDPAFLDMLGAGFNELIAYKGKVGNMEAPTGFSDIGPKLFVPIFCLFIPVVAMGFGFRTLTAED